MRRESTPFAHPWDEALVCEVADVIVGGTPSTAISSFWNGQIPWMASGDVHRQHVFDVPGRITELGLQHSNSVVVEPKAVAMALAGQGKTRGTVALTHVPICTNQSIALIKPKDERLNPEFLYQSLIPRYEEMRSRSAGGGRAGLTKGIIENLPIQIPHRCEQRRIAEILTTLDETIEQTEALIAKYQQIKAGLMHDLFTRGVTPDGRLRPTRDQAPHLYKESPLGWIPEAWEVKRLDSVSEVNRGKFAYRPRNEPRFYGGQYPFIQTGDVAISEGRRLFGFSQTLNHLGLSISRLFPANTVMVTIAANIADTCIIGIPMCVPDSLVAVQPKEADDARFIELSIRRRKSWLTARAPQTAQKNINLEDLRPLRISWPSSVERTQISGIFESHDAALFSAEAEVAKLRQQKHGLMQDLLTGQVRVKVSETVA